jgi:NADH-quinone oxidoreductase subunit D
MASWISDQLDAMYTQHAPGLSAEDLAAYDLQGWLSPEAPAGIITPRNLRRVATTHGMLETDHFILNLGPSHPAMHGALRMIIELDGELVMSSEAHVGFLHRGIEKLAETRRYNTIGTLMDRGDYATSIMGEWALARAAERLGDIEVPARAEWIRTVVAEVNRLASHYLWLGPLGLDSGAMGSFLYMMRDREACLEMLEAVTGSRMMFNYVRPGGVAFDWNREGNDKLATYLEKADEYLDEHWEVLIDSELFHQRVIGVGLVPHEMALSFAATGFIARASGIDWDLRRDRPYGYYDKLDFDVLVLDGEDIWSRVLVRFDEMKQSIRMLKQLLEMGPPEGEHTAKLPKILRLPEGEAYSSVEGARGELGVHLYSTGGDTPYRLRYRPPIQFHVAIADTIAPGQWLADAILSYASFDFCFGEVDR